jgi:hypothetical protein
MKSKSSPSRTVPYFVSEGQEIQGDGLTKPQIRNVQHDAAAVGPAGLPVTVGCTAAMITAVECGIMFTLNGR